jgi:hypothetical protein
MPRGPFWTWSKRFAEAPQPQRHDPGHRPGVAHARKLPGFPAGPRLSRDRPAISGGRPDGWPGYAPPLLQSVLAYFSTTISKSRLIETWRLIPVGRPALFLAPVIPWVRVLPRFLLDLHIGPFLRRWLANRGRRSHQRLSRLLRPLNLRAGTRRRTLVRRKIRGPVCGRALWPRELVRLRRRSAGCHHGTIHCA